MPHDILIILVIQAKRHEKQRRANGEEEMRIWWIGSLGLKTLVWGVDEGSTVVQKVSYHTGSKHISWLVRIHRKVKAGVHS